MDSSHYNPSYDQWNPPLPLLPPPPPPLPPPPPRESHPDSPSFHLLSRQNGEQRHHYLPPMPAVNQPSSFIYSQHPPPPPPQQHLPEKVRFEFRRVSQPSSSIRTCTQPRDISQPARVGYNDKRPDSWTVDAVQGRVDTGRSRINQSQLKAESVRCFRGLDDGHRSLSSRVGYMSSGVTVRRDMSRSSASHGGDRNWRWDEAPHNGGRVLPLRKRYDYYHLHRGRRDGSNESKRTTPGKQTQKKSALLRLGTPRDHHNGRENARNRCSYSGRRLVAKPVASPASVGIRPRRSVTPRSSKPRRALVPDKVEKASVTEVNGNRSMLKSREDLLDGTGTGCKARLPKGLEMEDNVKKKTNTSSKKLVISWSTVADLSCGSEARIRFAGMSMCSVGSQPCEDLADQVLAKSDSGCIEDDSKGINKNVDSLSSENDSRRGLPKGPVSSDSLDIPCVSTELANANNNGPGDLANAHSFTVCTFTNTTVNPVSEDENGSRTESMETRALNGAAEVADDRDSDKGKKACVKGTSSSLTKVDVKESSTVLPVNRTDGCSRSDESSLAMAVPSDEFMENVSAERLLPDEDLGIASRGGLMHEENNCAENTDVDAQVEKTNPSGGTLNYKTPGTDIVAVTGNLVFPCNSVSSSTGRSFRQIRSEIHVSATVDETCKDKPKPKHSGGTSKYRTGGTNIFAFSGDSVPRDSLSNSPRLYRKIRSEVHVASMVDDTSNYKEKAKPSGGTSKCRTPEADVTSDVGGQEKGSLNRVETDIFDGEVWSSVVKVSGTEILGDLRVLLPRSHSHAEVKDHVISVQDRDSQSTTSLSSRYEVENRKKKSNCSTQKRYSRALPFVSGPKKDANPPNKCHTWHRKLDTSASPFVAAKPLSSTLFTQPKLPLVTAQSSGSYVRIGNSLLRKPSYGSAGVTFGLPPSAIQLNCIEDKTTGSASKVDVGNASFRVKTGEIITLERQSNPPSDSSTSKVSNAIVTSSGKCPLPYSGDHLITGLPESIMDAAISGEANLPHSGGDASKTDTLAQTDYPSDCQQKRNHPKLDSSNLKRTVYVQRKENQLIAASDIHGATKGQIPASDGYFKRSRNQLVRTSASCVNHSPDDALDSQATTTMVSKRSSSPAFSDSAVTRPYKRSKFSLVWTQDDPQSRLRTSHMRYQRILPQLVPWKRVTYWRRLMNSVSGSALRNGSFSNSSQKLSMMRKRHTVYTRSTNGYSLRKSKVLSIGGSHLKWSKSIERDSRKANEEATLAVAGFSKKESENHSGQSTTRMTSRNHLTRERVFRIGSLRYKMDSSRRTLQRISDDDSPCSGPTENGKGAKRPFIPKRLVIGNEEYVRVGNGNQLVRDPKKRTRALANEKVRWSLHNVRLRLAKKKKYCQFFTRFGKCNKDDGKCPYVHDCSKIAVCTKFLNGLCANANCKLTHKVIPERMPDCSYFLQGLCNNEACPYRHVHVNPSAAICDGFLKGYCSDGDECRKKHSYTCPVFEATGSCSQGSKCKLHHSKNQSEGRKRKRLSEPSERNFRGRYFGSLHKVLEESEPMVVDRRPTSNSADFGIEGLDFIFLGATEYEAGDNSDLAAEQSVPSASEEVVSVYNLIRPVALMQ
ncbi:uncharacterized protein At1g21580-like isoform X2 [Raphanus sativus]|uniref:Uncharacterized protein At1g21580-like isoform X2 n=1 Tax=Raphanus sativus TaxID=3726 RepID=A0A9W3CLC2_RAPSA|nr:uncharacterized protein At1g21580-like isoform X2 [Raphanus sativus]